MLVSLDELYNGEDVAHCPSCSLLIRVIYDRADFVREAEVVVGPEPPASGSAIRVA